MDRQGYFADIEYEVYTVYEQMSPSYMHFYSYFYGYEPPNFLDHFRYCELGCGQGIGLLMFAAAYPNAEFIGVDFSEAQNGRARAIAHDMGLDNLTFLTSDFAAFAQSTQPPQDVIALHGVWSWINTRVRAEVVTAIRRHLAPRGLVYMAANVMPGWAEVVPCQHLLRGLRERLPAATAQKVFQSFGQFLETNPKTYADSAKLKRLFSAGEQKESASYLAHEYLHDSWIIDYFSEIVSAMKASDVDHLGRGSLRVLLPELDYTPAQMAYIEQFADLGFREDLKDFLLHSQFRVDFFGRGLRSVSAAERQAGLSRCCLGLVSRHLSPNARITGHQGSAVLDQGLAQPILERLSAGPAVIQDLMAMAPLQAAGFEASLRAIIGLLRLGNVELGLDDPASERIRDRVRRCNEVLVRYSGQHRGQVQMISPILRTPFTVPRSEVGIVRALLEQADPIAVALPNLGTLQTLGLADCIPDWRSEGGRQTDGPSPHAQGPSAAA